MQKIIKGVALKVTAISLCTLLLCGCKNSSEVDVTDLNSVTSGRERVTAGGVYVYVTGQVKNPGVYEVSKGARLYQVIEKAGGLTGKAQKGYLNLAETVVDGQQVQVLSKKQYKKIKQGSIQSEEEMSPSKDGAININRATAEELTNLAGIGDSKANAIVKYRQKNGSFSSIEEIKNVTGIGDATFENIKEQITV